MATINSAKAAGFRTLSFTGVDDALREAERIADAERRGTLTRIGNWTPGQAFGHVAAWTDYGFDGYPPTLCPPWFIRIAMKLMRKRMFSKPMPRGVKIPGISGGTVATEPMETDEGLAKLRAAFLRLDAGPPQLPHPIFGPLSHEDWKKMHINHAALHMGYFNPGA